MSGKRKLMLSQLEGDGTCSLEIELLPTGDFYVEMTGQTIKGDYETIRGQIPNPINGGGDLNRYNTLKKLYDVLEYNPTEK